MQTIPLSTTPLPRQADATRAILARRAREELDEISRDHFVSGWDDDDAELGWVDETVVAGSRRRLH